MSGSTASPVPVTSTEVIKLDFKPCRRCSGPKAAPVPGYISATAAALISMFVVEGTDDEVHQMARDFLHDLAEYGYRVTRIPQRRAVSEEDYASAFSEDDAVTLPLDFSGVDDDMDDTSVPADQCPFFNGNARRCALSVDHDGEHIYLITTTQEGTTE